MSEKSLQPFDEWIAKLRTVHISRRQFLKTTGVAAGAALASACAPAGAPQGAEQQEPAPPAKESEIEVLWDGEVFDAQGETLRLADWGGFWEEMQRENLLDQFEKDFNCKVTYDGAWPWFPKYVAGGPDNPPYDVSNWNLPELYKTGAAGDFFVDQETMKANIPNSKDLWPFAFNRYGLTYLFSQYGFVYRKDLVDPPITSFEQFWEERFADKRGTYITSNTLQHVFFQAAAKWFGESEHDIEAGFDAMRRAMPMKISDFTGNMQTLYERGEVVVAVQHDGEPYMQIDNGIDLGWFYWDHWKPILTQTKTVSKGSSEVRKKLAYALIDRSLSPEYQEAIGKTLYLRPTNKKTRVPPNLQDKGVENTADALEGLVVPDWDWWNNNEQQIVEMVNKIFSGEA